MKTLKGLILFFCFLLAGHTYAGDKTSFLKRQFTASTGFKLNYRVLYPENYNPEKKYPILLLLHGAGERGSDNEAQLKYGAEMLASHDNQVDYPAIIIFPQCPEGDYWVDYQRPGGGLKRSYPYNAPITKPLAAVKELLDRYIAGGSVDTKRVYVSGLSMGGMGTFDLVLRYPPLFAAAVPICGAVNLKRASGFKGKTAFSIYHGGSDGTVDVSFSRQAYEALSKASADVRYKEFPGVNHNSWDPAFAEADFLSWMFGHSL